MPDGGKRKPMPSTVAEGLLGRGLSWVVVLGNGAIAVLLMALVPVAIRDGASGVQLLFFGSVIIAWISIAWYAAVLLVVRPRHTVESLLSASVESAGGLVVPGSVRASVGASLAAVAFTAAALSGSLLADGGWAWFLVVVAVAFAAAAVDQGFGARQRRFLVMTPEAVEAGSFCGAARVNWEDIASITVQQGHGGHLVFRIQAQDGASSWRRMTRHPLHKARTHCDLEPSALDLDPALLGVNLLAAWEDATVRTAINAATTSARLVEPEWAMRSATSPRCALLLRHYRPERAAD